MKHIKISLDDRSLDLARGLADRYGQAASISSVIRRSICLLAGRWQQIGDAQHEAEAEKAVMIEFLSAARRGNAVR